MNERDGRKLGTYILAALAMLIGIAGCVLEVSPQIDENPMAPVVVRHPLDSCRPSSCANGMVCRDGNCQPEGTTPCEREWLRAWADGSIGGLGGVVRHRTRSSLMDRIHRRDEVRVCMSFDLARGHGEPKIVVNAAMINALRKVNEDVINNWRVGLAGHPNWIRDTRVPVVIVRIGVSPDVKLHNPPDVTIYRNARAECGSKSGYDLRLRYSNWNFGVHKGDPDPDACGDPDYKIAAACPGKISTMAYGAWQGNGPGFTRIGWPLAMREAKDRNTQYPAFTAHEIGHTMGLPDMRDRWYDYSETGLSRRCRDYKIYVRAAGLDPDTYWRPNWTPIALMESTRNPMSRFDIMVLRRAWASAYNARHAE